MAGLVHGAHIVSIRSPHRSEGRLKRDAMGLPKHHMFQSAPPTEVRGDMHKLAEIKLRLVVSIRSPHRSEGRLCLYRLP